MVVNAEVNLLKAHGHEVRLYERTNSELQQCHLLEQGRFAFLVGWSKDGYSAVKDILSDFHPDLMHVHNYKFMLSPSIFAAARENEVATVLTLHNYRLICPGGLFLCRGSVCEDCLKDGFAYRMLWRKCYSDSLPKNILQLRLFLATRKRELLKSYVDRYIVLSHFAREKFIRGGIPEGQISYKPNFIADPLQGVSAADQTERKALYVGRLSREKGLPTLMNAWKNIDYPLSIIGDGDMGSSLRDQARNNIQFQGYLSRQDCLSAISKSSFLVFPSECYEGFPLSILETMALGRPVLASDLGARSELIEDGKTGLLYKAGCVEDLRRKAQMLIENPAWCDELGRMARQRYLDLYGDEQNYSMLMNIYQEALQRRRNRTDKRAVQ